MEIKSKKEIKALIRRIFTYNSWRLGDKPFENRPEVYTENDVNELFEDIIENLEFYAHLVGQLTEFPSNIKISKMSNVSCQCVPEKKTVKPMNQRINEAPILPVANPNKDSFIQS